MNTSAEYPFRETPLRDGLANYAIDPFEFHFSVFGKVVHHHKIGLPDAIRHLLVIIRFQSFDHHSLFVEIFNLLNHIAIRINIKTKPVILTSPFISVLSTYEVSDSGTVAVIDDPLHIGGFAGDLFAVFIYLLKYLMRSGLILLVLC